MSHEFEPKPQPSEGEIWLGQLGLGHFAHTPVIHDGQETTVAELFQEKSGDHVRGPMQVLAQLDESKPDEKAKKDRFTEVLLISARKHFPQIFNEDGTPKQPSE